MIQTVRSIVVRKEASVLEEGRTMFPTGKNTNLDKACSLLLSPPVNIVDFVKTCLELQSDPPRAADVMVTESQEESDYAAEEAEGEIREEGQVAVESDEEEEEEDDEEAEVEDDEEEDENRNEDEAFEDETM